MDPHTGKFHKLTRAEAEEEVPLTSDCRKFHHPALSALSAAAKALDRDRLVLPDGSPVPDTWLVVRKGEKVVIKGHTFEVQWIGRDAILLQPVPLEIGKEGEGT